MTQLAEPLPGQQERNDLYEYIGHHIRTYRERAGVSQLELARYVGCGTTEVSNWEHGGRISVHHLLGVAAAFDVDVSALLPRGGQ